MSEVIIEKQEVKTRVRPTITLSDDYNRLRNKPKINGVELSGEMMPQQLDLLTSRLSEYPEISLDVAISNAFLLVTNNDGETNKLKVSSVTEGRFSTGVSLDDTQIGNYLFKEMEGE